MLSARRQKARSRRIREMDIFSNYENMDVILSENNSKSIEWELENVTNHSGGHGVSDTIHSSSLFSDYL